MLDEFFEDINDKIEDYVNENFQKTTVEALGFDTRGYVLAIYASEQAIVVQGRTNALDYYGGMEYVKGDDRKELGSWTFYLAENNERVRSHLSRLFPDMKETEDDEG